MFTLRHTGGKGWEVYRDGAPWTCSYVEDFDDAVEVLSWWHPAAVAPTLAAMKCEVCSSTKGVRPEAVGATFLLICHKCRAVPSTAVGNPDRLAKVSKHSHVVNELTREQWTEMTRREVRKFNLKSTGSLAVDELLRLPEAPKREAYPMARTIARSEAPETCQVCEVPLAVEFVDGVVKHCGWGYLCVACHKTHGIGLGTGRGQLYGLKEDGDFHRVTL